MSHFFLAELVRREQRHGFDVYISGRELARDLEAPPGMYLDRALFIRTEALRRWLWEKYEEWRWNRKNEAMGRALAAYPFAERPETALDERVRRAGPRDRGRSRAAEPARERQSLQDRQLDSVAGRFTDGPVEGGTLLVSCESGAVVASVARIDAATNDPAGLAPLPVVVR